MSSINNLKQIPDNNPKKLSFRATANPYFGLVNNNSGKDTIQLSANKVSFKSNDTLTEKANSGTIFSNKPLSIFSDVLKAKNCRLLRLKMRKGLWK